MPEIIYYLIFVILIAASLCFIYFFTHSLLYPCVHACTLACVRREAWPETETLPLNESTHHKQQRRQIFINFKEKFQGSPSDFDEHGIGSEMPYHDYDRYYDRDNSHNIKDIDLLLHITKNIDSVK